MKKTPRADQMYLQAAPQILVSARDKNGRNNVQAAGYAGNASHNPDMLMVGLEPTRLTYEIVKESNSFVVNIPMTNFAKEFYYLGSHSGRDVDKFAALNLKWQDADRIDAPILLDCPVNIECSVVTSLRPGSNELFIGKVEAVHVDEKYLDDAGKILWSNMDLIPSIKSAQKYSDV